ncbi:MAG: hydrogenase/urease maturation nickel metallochaperone HypA [Thermoproteota archaeon]|nr:hydrogenase maturation nickel metallochaperone HypA [Candidatus Brockarchaeota archaeon]
MHEWSLAQAIVESVVEAANNKKAKRVKTLEVEVGSLAMLDKDIILEAIKTLSESTKLEGAEIKIYEEETKFRCKKCGKTWSFNEEKEEIEKRWEDSKIKDEYGTDDLPIHYFPELIFTMTSCPSCKSKDFEIIGSREITIKSVTIEV